MDWRMNRNLILLSILVLEILPLQAIPCDSCGNECQSACGTKHFRTCCFNYLRKRTDPNALKLITTNKSLIDFIMLQGRALYTQNELGRAATHRQLIKSHHTGNGTLIDLGQLPTYYG